jgi:hypothetical protein
MKPIPKFENYSCDENGNFFRNKKMLKTVQNEKGYLHIRLYKNGKQFSFRAHRVVYETFIGPILDGHEINHKNGVKDDNNVNNLELCTHTENMRHALKEGLLIPKQGKENKLSIPIYGISLVTSEKLFFDSQADAKRYGFNQGNIQSVLSGKRNQHRGYKWFYA